LTIQGGRREGQKEAGNYRSKGERGSEGRPEPEAMERKVSPSQD